MKSNFISFFISILFLSSCNYFSQTKESKILDGIKRYTADYFFKKNLKTEIIDIKINSLNEINADSVVMRFSKEKVFQIAIKLSGSRTYEEWDNKVRQGNDNFIEKALNSKELNDYVQMTKKYIGQQVYEVHVYLKYITMDLDERNKNNHLYEDQTFIVDKNFVVLGIKP